MKQIQIFVEEVEKTLIQCPPECNLLRCDKIHHREITCGLGKKKELDKSTVYENIKRLKPRIIHHIIHQHVQETD